MKKHILKSNTSCKLLVVFQTLYVVDCLLYEGILIFFYKRPNVFIDYDGYSASDPTSSLVQGGIVW